MTHNQTLKKNFSTLRDDYLVEIYKGLIHKKTVNQIHKELYNKTINRENKDTKAYEIAVKSTNRLKKMLPNGSDAIKIAKQKHPQYANSIKTEGDAIAILLIALMSHIKLDENITKAFNNHRYEWENRAKSEAIVEDIEHNRGLDTPKVFYLCSQHNDCAKDHLNLQGRIYIDNQWGRYVGEAIKPDIRDYIASHNVITIQEATSKPYWLITRPHCRHYFKAIDTKQVLNKSVKRLIQKYNMKRKIGDRQYLQTMESGVGSLQRKLLGEYRNAQLMVDKYKERLDTHQRLYATYPSEILKNAINKDKMLINKWRKYMNELYKRGER